MNTQTDVYVALVRVIFIVDEQSWQNCSKLPGYYTCMTALTAGKSMYIMLTKGNK